MQNRFKLIWQDIRPLVLFFVLMVVFRSSWADWYTVPSGSMRPTIVEGDRIVVDKLAYDLRVPLTHVSLSRMADPVRGDIVVFESKAANDRLVKRLIGLPGDVIELKDNRLFINGEAAVYSPLTRQGDTLHATETLGNMSHPVAFSAYGSGRLANAGPVQVPPGHYLVLGDNRDNSADSRVYGFVPRNEILGSASRVAFSLDYDDHYLPRKDRFLSKL